MVNLKEILKDSSRENFISNKKLHFFSSIFSPLLTYLFVNLGFSANSVTVIFIITGIVGGLLLFLVPFEYFWISYLLWRLHIIIDMSDGEVARYTKKFNDNAIYWDFMGHSIIYPLYFGGIFFIAFHEMDLNIAIGLIGTIVVSLLRAVTKNFQAMLYRTSKKTESEKKVYTRRNNILLYILSFEGFLFTILLISVFDSFTNLLSFVIYFYILVFILIVSYKFYKLTNNGVYISRN